MLVIVDIEVTPAITKIDVLRNTVNFAKEIVGELALLCQEIASRAMEPMLLH